MKLLESNVLVMSVCLIAGVPVNGPGPFFYFYISLAYFIFFRYMSIIFNIVDPLLA